jgi:hypothetical protein
MKKLALIALAILLAPAVHAQSSDASTKAVDLMNRPALLLPFDARGLWYNAVILTGTDANPILSFYVHLIDTSRNSCAAFFSISAQKVSMYPLDANCSKQAFEAAPSEVKFEIMSFNGPNMWVATWMTLKASGHSGKWMVDVEPTHSQTHASGNDLTRRADKRIPIYDFIRLALQDFHTALYAFWDQRNDVIRPGDEADFHKQAAAWRLLTVKPELPDEVKRQRTLAEAYLEDKDIPKAVEHYKAALKAYPTWPQGWFNLAIIDGSLGNYDSAVQEMKFYLELTPDASDAEAAKAKIIIWEDKAKH